MLCCRRSRTRRPRPRTCPPFGRRPRQSESNRSLFLPCSKKTPSLLMDVTRSVFDFLGGCGFGCTLLRLVVVSGRSVVSCLFCGGLLCSGRLFSRSTQHRIDALGQATSSLTSSQTRLASAWMHFPGQSDTSAVWVIWPRSPEREVEKAGMIKLFCH